MGKRLISIVALGAVFIVIAAAAFWSLLPWLVSTDAVQAAIERELGSVFDTPAELDGGVEVTIFPRPRARLTDVLVRAPDGGDLPILTSEVIEADVGLASLVGGRPQFSAFRLVRPHVQIVQQADGSVDWTRVSGRVGRLMAGRERHDDRDRTLGVVETENARITLYDMAGEVVEDITAIDATLDWAAAGSPLSLDAAAIWRGTSGTVSFSVDAPPAFFGGQPAQMRLAIESEAAELRFSGLANLGPTAFADGPIEFSTPSARSLFALLRTPMFPGRVLGAVDLSGPMLLAQRRARFEALDISVDGTQGAGVLEIALAGEDNRPAVTGTLDFQSLDLLQFLRAFVDLPQGPADDDPMAVGFGNLPDADLRVSAAGATFGGVTMANLAATAQVTDGRAIFDIGDAEAYGGHIQARLQLSTEEAPGRTEIIVSGQGIDSARLNETLPLPSALPRGQGDFAITVTTLIDRWRTMARNAYGTVSIAMDQGAISGLGYASLVANRDTSSYFSINTEERGEAFTAARINGDIKDGLITLRDSRITYADGQIGLTGIVSHGGGSLALTATAGPTPRIDEDGEPVAQPDAGPTTSFFIGGSWNRPFATPVRLAAPVGLPPAVID